MGARGEGGRQCGHQFGGVRLSRRPCGHPCAHSLPRVVCMGGAGTGAGVGAGAGAGAGRELLWCACRLCGSADTEDWLQSSPLAAAALSAHQPVAALPARAAAARTGRAFSGEFSQHSSQSTVLQGGPRDSAEVGARLSGRGLSGREAKWESTRVSSPCCRAGRAIAQKWEREVALRKRQKRGPPARVRSAALYVHLSMHA